VRAFLFTTVPPADCLIAAHERSPRPPSMARRSLDRSPTSCSPRE
jgi:hypothetical protein